MAAIASEQVLQTLAIHRPELEKMGVKSLRLFGSVARDEATDDSDIDFLVEFFEEPSLFEIFEVRYFLEDLFQRKIDIGLEEALREHLREPVLRDTIHAF
ncbi:DNA polymerase beta domain protein region [[Leptolyngbya] sp. PCC 7376]|nr:DNA polymerase beta domain protein region [[Leptolyngbya] sp. PCC 7376]